MTPPPDSIGKAYENLKRSYIDALTNNAAEALIAGEVRASNLLRIPLNFNLINSRAVTATRAYREDMIRFGGSEVTKIVNGVPTRQFEPWLQDMVARDQERVSEIIQNAISRGSSIRDTEKALQEVFTQGEHNARLTAYQETKALYNRGTMDRYAHENVQQGIWHHMDPQDNPREEHQELNGKVFDLDDPIWYEQELYNCKCWCEPVLIFLGVSNVAEEGNWVTINGAHILIKDGETVGDAFKRTTGNDLGGGSSGAGSNKFGGTNQEKQIAIGTKSSPSEIYKSIQNEDVEHTYVFDSNGNILAYTKGEERIVELPKEMQHLAKGNIGVHNHPRDSPPNKQDLLSSYNLDEKEGHIITREGTVYKMISPTGGWDHKEYSASSLDRWYDKAYSSNFDRLDRNFDISNPTNPDHQAQINAIRYALKKAGGHLEISHV